jgi:hypothetical protein
MAKNATARPYIKTTRRGPLSLVRPATYETASSECERVCDLARDVLFSYPVFKVRGIEGVIEDARAPQLLHQRV